jgi:hypothetical protein
MARWGTIEPLEHRAFLSAASYIITMDRAQLAFDQATVQSKLAADRKPLAADLAVRAHGDPALVVKLNTDLGEFAGKFQADRQAMNAARTTDVMAILSDRGNSIELAADRQKLRNDLASLQAVFDSDKADRNATVRQDQLAIAQSRTKVDASVINGDLAMLASDKAHVVAAVKADVQAIKSGRAIPVAPIDGTAGGGDSSDVNDGSYIMLTSPGGPITPEFLGIDFTGSG